MFYNDVSGCFIVKTERRTRPSARNHDAFLDLIPHSGISTIWTKRSAGCRTRWAPSVLLTPWANLSELHPTEQRSSSGVNAVTPHRVWAGFTSVLMLYLKQCSTEAELGLSRMSRNNTNAALLVLLPTKSKKKTFALSDLPEHVLPASTLQRRCLDLYPVWDVLWSQIRSAKTPSSGFECVVFTVSGRQRRSGRRCVWYGSVYRTKRRIALSSQQINGAGGLGDVKHGWRPVWRQEMQTCVWRPASALDLLQSNCCCVGVFRLHAPPCKSETLVDEIIG